MPRPTWILALLLTTQLAAAPTTLEELREARERLGTALDRGPAAAAVVLRELPGTIQSDRIRAWARAEPTPPGAVAAVARAYGALSTPARHAAAPLLAASGGPDEAARVTPFLGRLPEVPGFLRLRSRTFEVVLGMWLRGTPRQAVAGLEALAADRSLPAELRRRAQEAAWSVQQLRAPQDP
jgi:hypothetical protein